MTERRPSAQSELSIYVERDVASEEVDNGFSKGSHYVIAFGGDEQNLHVPVDAVYDQNGVEIKKPTVLEIIEALRLSGLKISNLERKMLRELLANEQGCLEVRYERARAMLKEE